MKYAADTRDKTGRDFHDPTRPVTGLLNRPVDRQNLQHLDQTLPRQTGKKQYTLQ